MWLKSQLYYCHYYLFLCLRTGKKSHALRHLYLIGTVFSTACRGGKLALEMSAIESFAEDRWNKTKGKGGAILFL